MSSISQRLDAEVFFTKVGNKAVCLLCGQSVAALKEYNISRHYATELDRKLARQQNVFVKGKLAQKALTHTSYRVAYNIATHSKPFSDGEFFKKCMLDVADQVCPENRQKFEEVSLSRRTAARRIKAIGEDLTSQLKGLVPSFQLFSPALDELTSMILHSCSSMYEAFQKTLKLPKNCCLWNQ